MLSLLGAGFSRIWGYLAAAGAALVALALAVAKIKQAGRNEVTAQVNQNSAETKGRVADAAVKTPTDKGSLVKDLQAGKFCLALLILLLAGCAPNVVVQTECLPIADYDEAFQRDAAAQLESLPADSPLVRMMGDYRRMRAMARACAADRRVSLPPDRQAIEKPWVDFGYESGKNGGNPPFPDFS